MWKDRIGLVLKEVTGDVMLMVQLFTNTQIHNEEIHIFPEYSSVRLEHISVLVLWLLHYHHSAVRVMGAVIADTSKNSPFECAVAMAADDEHLGVVPLHRLAQHIPRVPFHHLVHSVAHLCAELLGLVDDAEGALLEVRLHDRKHVRRAWSGEADGGGGCGLGGDGDEAVLLRLAGREEVLERPVQRVVAVLAFVHPHYHRHLRPRRRRRRRR
uniref:Uncharacterized protein n=1 Tax=Arundo donax TaxID=35708 RepID=A0A0A9G609_ARUDO